MHRRREHRARRAWERKQTFPSPRRPTGHRTTRRRMRQAWRYDIVHCVAYGPVLMD